MTQEDVSGVVAEELDYIPSGTSGSPQMHFKAMYNTVRRKGMEQDPKTSRADSLKEAIDLVHDSHPTFEPAYDREFFGITVADEEKP